MAVRLDVNVFDGKEEKAKKTNCVPLKDFNVSNKTLSDIRKALIDNGGLDASRAGSAFCSATGAQVNDSTSFADYMEILSENVGEEKEKPEKAANVTVHDVYIKTKDKKRTDRKTEAKELIKQELNLKLSDKPELLQASLEQLASSFNRADWVAEGNETSVNPADMSEKEWNAVIRNNNLLSAHRLVFSNLGRLTDGSKKVKFRRIERAPYSAFVLKPRKFASHEIPDADVKVEQVFHIPRFTVGDDSYVDAFETKSSTASAMARSSFSSIEAEASVEGGAFGFSAAISAGFSQSENNALSTQNTADSSTMNITYNFPRVVLYLDQFGVDLSQECASDLVGVKDASSLIAFHHKYGHFFATRIELGGRLFSSEKFSALGTKTEDEAATAMKIAAAASFSSSFVSGSVSYGQEKQTNAQNSSSNRAMQSSISWQAQGGDTLLCNNPSAWCPTVAPFHNWRVIKQEDVTPLGDFIGQIPGFEDIPEKFKSIAEVTRKKEVVSFRISLQDYQRNEKNKPEYLSLHHAWKIKGEVEEALSKVPDTILDISNNGYPGLSMETNSSENVFDIEVETLLNQAPTIEFKKRYHIYNRKRGLWLRAFTIPFKGKEITLLAAGPKNQATLFEFRDKSREGPMRNADDCSLVVYGPDGRQKGSIAYALETHGTSIGAMPYSVDNERWLRFTNLSIVDQRDVPT
ncbi:hypothetical protein N7471_000184 [Penicillium samsonianum]|uniref:uncharacterized protein n=1 Tax=Penicillium samsonianum TaxID=1882272 RepID=UPI002546C62F|nr:uncharacterized protein N7471_000184 [Penicillium samsonianum]KAJ6148985.1 hypothetical protein N7471_000184 [Penicillium samsonianum]